MKQLSFLFIWICLSLSACVGVSDISRRAPFNEAVGKELRTERASFLSPSRATDSTSEAMFSGGHPVLALHNAHAPPLNPDYWKKRVAEIPAGQPIRVIQVRKEVGDGQICYTAVGDIFVPKTGQFTRFYFDWGCDLTLNRAPWEPDSVPQTRSIR